MLELSNSLNHDESPELCDRLAALYNYMYRQLVNANLNRDPQVVDEVIELLDYERETWRQLMEKVGEEGTGEQAEAPAAAAGPYQANPAPGNPSAGTSTLSKSA